MKWQVSKVSRFTFTWSMIIHNHEWTSHRNHRLSFHCILTMELCRTTAEILQRRASQGRPSNLLEDEVHVEIGDGHITVFNDLKAAAEVKLREESRWHNIYPKASIKLAGDSVDGDLQVSVQLRDDPNVCGSCTAVQGSTLQLSNSFGDFGERATKHVQKEAKEAAEEIRLREQRQRELDEKFGAEVTQAVLRKQKMMMIFLFLCMLMVLAAMISCTVMAYNLQTELQGLGLASGLLLLCVCASCGVTGLMTASGFGAKALRDSVQAARPELQRYQDEGVQAGRDWRFLTFLSCFCCAPLVFVGCVVAMTAAFDQNGSGLLSAVLWAPLAVLMCCGAVRGWRWEDGSRTERAGYALGGALIFLFFWPVYLLSKCGFLKGLAELVLAPPKRSLDAAVHTTHEHTIVFEGNVLPKRETVCSWPGKYATAWDGLVAGSRQDDISAAVVFLPKGSEHFGFHDPIPAKFAKHGLQDLHGECWCTPLYGECKPWGCRWWSKWIANIELAVSQECTLVVYYFNGMKGQGQVEDFTTAGKENMRREATFRCKDAFLQSDTFQNAVEAGLNRLSKEQGPDSSSPYSREVHRLFLAWLPEQEAQFLQTSEGLGNSQKAEVAWLERNGYRYIEKEIWELESSSPKATGQATK